MNKSFPRIILCVCLLTASALAQVAQNPRPATHGDDVVKVYTDLVQTDVTVVDRQGRFVNGLKREDFELRIDGKLQPIGFFDRVEAGTASEEVQLAAARGAPSKEGPIAPVPLDRGRPVFFFIDDMHLTPTDLEHTRRLLAQFIDRDLKQNDEAEVVTASGRLGFLQQLTDNKSVLRTAAERLISRPGTARDGQRPPMSEYQALQIDRGDRDTLGYFVDALLAENRMMNRTSAEDEVRRRASMILEQAGYATTITLSSLDSLIRSSAKLPGRKLIFLISDGFFIDYRHSDSVDRMRVLTSVASNSGAVIYSIDARGLIASLSDASTKVAVDTSGRLSRGGQGEIVSSQDALSALAGDTGGRALFNTNDLHSAVSNGLKETSKYYLLAWRPEREGNNSTKFRRIDVAIPGRPELTVRIHRGFFDIEPPPVNRGKKPNDQTTQEQTVEAKLKEAIIAPYPDRQIPISLSLNYLDTPDKGIALSVSIQIPAEFLSFDSDSKEWAQVDLAGAVFDDRGQPGGRFGERVTLSAATVEAKSSGRQLTYSHTVFLGPGLYQGRVAVRDVRTGHLGSANAWIEIPNLSDHKLSLSSLLLGERPGAGFAGPATLTLPGSAPGSVLLSIDRRFKRDSFLRYLVFVYNSARANTDSAPDLVVQMQVLRDGQPVATTALKKVSTDGVQDLQRLPYAAELPLDGFPAGHYLLLFTAIDRIAKSSASQQVRFEIQ